MADFLVGGALLGALLGELLKVIIDLSKGSIHFDGVLKDIVFNINALSGVIKQLDVLSDFLEIPENYTNNLKEQIMKGKQLILECNSMENSWVLIKYSKAPFYTKKLRNLDAALHRASYFLMLQLFVEQMKNYNNNKQAALAETNCNCRRRRLLHSIFDKIMNKIKTKFLGTSSDRSVGCSDHRHVHEITKVPLHFYDHNQLKGPNYADRLLGVAVEYMKDDHSNGVGTRFEERIKMVGDDRYEKIFDWTFETVGGEKLKNWFRCHLITEISAHPLKGVLYVSTHKLAFCTKKPIDHIDHTHDTTKNQLYLKVIIPFELVKAVSKSSNGVNNSYDEYMEVNCVDDQQFRFAKLLNYNEAKKCLQQLPITSTVTCPRCA